MRLVTGAMAFWIAIGALVAPASAKKKRKNPSKDTIKLVEYVIKAETAELDHTMIPPFMKVVVETLPRKLRARYKAKRAELNALRKIARNKKKGLIRRAAVTDEAKCDPEKGTKRYINALRQMGFEQISEDELEHIMKKTRCSECELYEESSLKVVLVPAKKKKALPTRYLFISPNDPWMALVAEFRGGGRGGTNFFGSYHAACH